MMRIVALVSMMLFIPFVYADKPITVQSANDGNKQQQPKKLDLSIPAEGLEYQPDTTNKDTNTVYQESEAQKAKRKHCADLSRQIEALKGKLKPTRRSALVNQHRAECMGKGAWQHE